MKKIGLLIGITILMFSSCQTEEIETNQDNELLSAENKELSIYKLAVLMDNLALNKELSNSDKIRLTTFSKSIKSDLTTFELNNSETQSSKTARGGNCLASSICGSNYIQCIQWATYWEDLLRSCNGPVNDRPNNCDQIRRDYIRNLDGIESNYHKCQKQLSSCIKRKCPKDEEGGGVGAQV